MRLRPQRDSRTENFGFQLDLSVLAQSATWTDDDWRLFNEEKVILFHISILRF